MLRKRGPVHAKVHVPVHTLYVAMKPWTNKSLSLGVIGLLLVALGTSVCFLSTTIFRQILQSGLALSPTAHSFDMWKDTSNLPPMILEIYLFNWTNPEELGQRDKKPRFDQLGPYCFNEIRQKDNITFHHENKTVSYRLRRLWYFNAECSNGTLNDNITSLDVVAVSAAHKIRNWELEWQATLSLFMGQRSIYMRKTVDELLFAGYSDTLLTMGKMMVPDSDVPMYDRFGWFYMRNDSTDMDGQFNMDTGEEDISQLGTLRKWNYNDLTKFYKSPCNIIEGSAGEFWPPNRSKDDIMLFSTDLCRPLIYEYTKTISYLGLEGYQYAIGKKTLSNSTRRRYPHEQAKFLEPTTTTEDFFMTEHEFMELPTTTSTSDDDSTANREDEDDDESPDVVNMGNCYCNGECVPSGLMNVSACRFGAPVFISLPHFHKVDPSVLDLVEGLKPDESDDFTITLEPTTGIPLMVSARLQINILLQPSKYVSLFKNVPQLYMPMFWFKLNIKVTDEMATSLKHLLALPMVIMCSGIATAIIGLCLIAAMAFLYRWTKKQLPPIVSTDNTAKQMDESPEKKAEMVYMDKISGKDEDANVRSDRRLYAKLY